MSTARTSTAPTSTGTKSATRPRWWLQPKWLITVLITILLATGQIQYGILRNIWVLPVAVGAALATETLLSLSIRGRIGSVQSAYISGTSTVILIKAPDLWPYALCAAIAVASKYALTYRRRHLWNPTNFAISALVLTTSVPILSIQMGNTPWVVALVWTIGLLIVSRAGVLHVTLAYLAAFVAFAYLRSLVLPVGFWTEVSPLTGAMYQFFAFFMVTDPPTTVSTRKGRILVVVLIAAVECAIRLLPHDPAYTKLLVAPPILALAIVGPVAKWIDIRRTIDRGLEPKSDASGARTAPAA
ncbi:MAG: RnfABCDGE type electron transport complex subunit D [Planctomycetota bacterium]